MARGSRLVHGRILLADADRNRYEELRLDTARHPSESADRLVLRLLAFLLLHEEGITFRGGGVSEGEAPDLAVHDATGRPVHWIDVGTPARERLLRAARRAKVTVVTHDGLLPRWRRRHGGRLPEFPGQILVLRHSLVESLAEGLDRRFRWQATISGGTLYLEADGRLFTSALELPE